MLALKMGLTMGPQAQVICNHQELRGKEQILPSNLQRDEALLTLGFQTSGLQSRERINFCCVKGPLAPHSHRFVMFVTAAAGTLYNT